VKFVCLILITVLFTLAGCDTEPPESGTDITINGERIKAPAGHSVTIEGQSDIGPGIEKRRGSAEGVGAGLDTESERAAQEFRSTAPFAWLPGGYRADGGSTSIQQTLIGGTQASPLLWVGILSLVGAGVAFYFGLRRAALICAVLGGSFVVASMLPAWAFVLIGLAGVVTVAVYIYAELKAKKNTELAKSFVWARRDMPPEQRIVLDKALDPHLTKQGAIDDSKTLAKLQASEGIV
jgi:uncharacterized membrane protein YuzA (DUF378 family)/predicted small secreted protein